MKRLFLIALFFIGCFSLSAQIDHFPQLLVGGKVGIVVPQGDFSKVASRGMGFHLEGRWLLNERIAVGLESAYTQFQKKDDFWNAGNRGENDVAYQLIPILFNGMYFFKVWDRDFHPYASMAFGYFLFRNRVEFTSSNPEPFPFNGDPSLSYTIKENKVGLAPSVGFMYNLSKYLLFDISARYTLIPNFPESLSVEQKYANVSQGYEKYHMEENYTLGYKSLSSLSISIGLFYRF